MWVRRDNDRGNGTDVCTIGGHRGDSGDDDNDNDNDERQISTAPDHDDGRGDDH